MVYPVDLEKMKSDTGFINYLYGLIGLRKYGIGIYISTINGIEEGLKGPPTVAQAG